ncbi:MAG: ECF transporter S component [Clostridia bacterium]|nr:ECF transporter S component [Clostridia bacterium]
MHDAKIKKMTTIAMLCAISYVAMFTVRIPVVLFLKYEPKDVIIAIGGFMMGPMAAFIVSFVVGLIEMFTVSDTGIIGFVMNVLSSCSFACVAALIYKYRKNIKGAVAGLVAGTVTMVSVMLLWNYLITPLYMNVPRSEVIKLLVPAILPFNVLKGFLNSAITFLIYKPVVGALRRTKLIASAKNGGKTSVGFSIVAVIVIITCILSVLVLKGVI